MITTKKDLKEYLTSDYGRYPAQRMPLILRWLIKDEQTRVKHYIWVLRYTEYFINKKSKFAYIWLFWLKRLSNILNIHVNPNCCGKGLRLVHIGGGYLPERQ